MAQINVNCLKGRFFIINKRGQLFKLFQNILLRTPLNSLRELRADAITTPPAIFQEGLYISTPEFWHEFQKYELQDEKEQKKARQTFLKYWLRSCTRCTPYATFAGNALVSVGDNTLLTLSERNNHRRYLRIDTNYLASIIQVLLQDANIKNQIRFFTNNSLHTTNDSYRYAQYLIQGNVRNYHLNSVERSNYVDCILTKAKDGVTLPDLAKMLVQIAAIGYDEAMAFIEELVHAQALVSELEPCITGKEPLNNLVEKLELLHDTGNALIPLKHIRSLLESPGEGIAHYKNVENELQKLNPAGDISKNTIQVDLFLKHEQATIDKQLLENIVAQVSSLLVFTRKKNNSGLENFKSKFIEKYEDAEAPLFAAMDPDIGIGYGDVYAESIGGSDLINDLPLPTTKSNMVTFDFIQKYALKKYDDYIISNKAHIEISDEEIALFKADTKDATFPNSMFLMGNLFENNGQSGTGNFLFGIQTFNGPSGQCH